MSASLPRFNARGLLPPGDYELTLQELAQSHLVTGDGRQPWDAAWRGWLVSNLSYLVRQLWDNGVTEIFAGGSFAEDRAHPGDIDGYFVVDFDTARYGYRPSGLYSRLNEAADEDIWTWSDGDRTYDPIKRERKIPMWRKYKVELWPHVPGVGTSGIEDEFGNVCEFPAAFRKSRQYVPRGIIKLIRSR